MTAVTVFTSSSYFMRSVPSSLYCLTSFLYSGLSTSNFSASKWSMNFLMSMGMMVMMMMTTTMIMMMMLITVCPT